MPRLSKETLRAYVLLATNGDEDHPAAELAYYSEPIGDTGEYMRFIIVHTGPDGTKTDVLVENYVKGAHSDGHMERLFVDRMAQSVVTMWTEQKTSFEDARTRFEKIKEAIGLAGFPNE